MSDIDRTRLSVHEDAVDSRVGEETVILHLGSKTYFGLDEVGSLIWSLLKEGKTPVEICTQVSAEYGQDPQQVETDLRAFLDELSAKQLVVGTLKS